MAMISRMQKEFTPLESCWEEFVGNGSLDRDALSTEIADAWERCARLGTNPYVGNSKRRLAESEVQEMLQRHKELIDVARPFMAKLHRFVAGSGFVVLLADERGYLMETIGDQDTVREAENIDLLPGACWREEEIGNNGVGTAVVLKKPVQVSGKEHYCRKHHSWTCSGAPILNEDKQVIGILEMSGPVEKTHLHTLGMVVAAVEAISDQLRIQQKNRELVLLSNRLGYIYNTVSDGIMVIDRQGIITQINPAVERILGQNSRKIMGIPVKELFEPGQRVEEMLDSGRDFSYSELTLGIGEAVQCLVSGKAIMDEQGKVNGGVIFINPINHIKSLVNRFSGAQASLHFSDIIGQSQELSRVVRIASLAASSESNILLEGESGTGKEVFAQAIHNASSRRDAPFIAVNCGAIPRELLGSELFGYVDGAFTGARRGGRPGKFELASGGSIFLDEIGEMPLGKQVSLLRVLQERTVTRIGGDKVIPVDVRVICASNRKLHEEVEKGNFRRDLFYRLNVIAITLPPLRQRKEDIPLLFHHFLQDISQKLGVKTPQVEAEVIHSLQDYDWPGNVRELQNVVERMVNIAEESRISQEHLPQEISHPAARSLKELENGEDSQLLSLSTERRKRKEMEQEREREEIMALLVLHGGNVSRVAKSLGVSRNTIYRKIKQYRIKI
jgi:PAS domain S-box-containing protein